MPRRTTVDAVKTLLGGNYGTVNGILSDLDQYITGASLLVDQVVIVQNRQSTMFVLTSANYEMMERCCAAYYYTLYDPLYAQRSTEGASGGFVAEKLDANRYKAMAIQQDPTGVLNALLNRTIAGSKWMGKTPSEAIPYDERS